MDPDLALAKESGSGVWEVSASQDPEKAKIKKLDSSPLRSQENKK